MRKNSLRSGFTLVELLIVIAIIAMLSGLSAVAYGGFVKSAKKRQSQAIVNTLVAGIEQYHAEYGSFPPPVRDVVTAGESFNTDETKMEALLLELTGEIVRKKDEGRLDDSETVINYKGKNFLPLDNAKGDKNGIIRNATGEAESLVDPFGNPFTLVFNSSYDVNGLAIPSEYLKGDQADGDTIQAKLLIYNSGQDEKGGTKDDVTSWN